MYLHYEDTLIIPSNQNWPNQPGKEIILGIRNLESKCVKGRAKKKKGKGEQVTHRRETIRFTHVTIGASELYGALGTE